MSFYFYRDAKRLARKLQTIVREEFNPDASLNWFQKATACALGFDHVHHMNVSLPGEATWNGQACAEYLSSNGYLLREDAQQAVAWLEEELPHVVEGRSVKDQIEEQAEFA